MTPLPMPEMTPPLTRMYFMARSEGRVERRGKELGGESRSTEGRRGFSRRRFGRGVEALINECLSKLQRAGAVDKLARRGKEGGKLSLG
jgi:hypothetical protein